MKTPQKHHKLAKAASKAKNIKAPHAATAKRTIVTTPKAKITLKSQKASSTTTSPMASVLAQTNPLFKTTLFANAFRLFSQGPTREVGAVKWFDSAKGFGFIVRPSGAELFVHFTNVVGTGYRTLSEGQNVEYTVGSSTKGPAAVDVVPVQEQTQDV